jgi:hypothetical protein
MKHEKTIIKYSYEDGARECARKMGIGRGTVLNYRNKLKNKVWQKLKDQRDWRYYRKVYRSNGIEPCAGCNGRKAVLNDWFPIKCN